MKIQVRCRNCNSSFERESYEVKPERNSFCNQSCAAQYNNKITPKRKRKFADRGWLRSLCKCGQRKVSYSKMCIKCKNEETKQWRLTKTKGDFFKEKANWQSARSGIRAQSHKNFIKSEKKKCCSICGYDKHFEVAHIKSVSDFSNESTLAEICHIDNLIGLCPNHHWEFDNGILKIGGPTGLG